MKYSLRNFLIVFLLSIIIFSVAAVFLVDLVSDMLTPPSSEGEISDPIINKEESIIPKDSKNTLTYLILGIGDEGDAEYLLLTHINRIKKTFTISDLPANLRIELDGGYQTLGEAVLSRDLEFVRDKVYALTAVKIDYLFSVEAHGFEELVNRLGGIDYNVPTDFKQVDEVRGITIDIPAGAQHLDGETALNVLRYSNYPSDVEVNRSKTFRSLMAALARSVLGAENKESIQVEISTNLAEYFSTFTTDMTMAEAEEHLGTLFAFSSYEFSEFSYPGKSEDTYFLPDTMEARTTYKACRE